MRVRPSSGSVLPVRSCTTRATIPATVRQDSRKNTVTAVNAMFFASHAQVSSNRYVHFAPGRAHGTCATSTPWSGHCTRGAADSRKVRVVPVSTVRHRLVPTPASYPGHDRRHCAHRPADRASGRTDTTRISPSPSGSACTVTSPMTMPWTPNSCPNTLVLRMPCSPPSFRSLSKTKTTAEHGMSHQTRWSGTHNNVTRALPNAILEAFATEVPVVSTKVTGVVDLVTDGETGVLVEPRNPTQLATALRRVLSDTTLTTAISRSARQFVTTYFSRDAVTQAQMNLLLAPARSRTTDESHR